MGAAGATKDLSWGRSGGLGRVRDGPEGLDEDRSKDGDAGRDDVVGNSVSIDGKGKGGVGIPNRGEKAFLGQRVYVLRRARVGFAVGCSSWRKGRLEIVGEEMGATELSVSELGAIEEEGGAESVVGGSDKVRMIMT